MHLDGIAAIITGGSGLGAATATLLARNEVRMALFNTDVDRGKAKARELGDTFMNVDVADEASEEAAVADVEAAHGVARVLINCAGIAPPARTPSTAKVSFSRLPASAR